MELEGVQLQQDINAIMLEMEGDGDGDGDEKEDNEMGSREGKGGGVEREVSKDESSRERGADAGMHGQRQLTHQPLGQQYGQQQAQQLQQQQQPQPYQQQEQRQGLNTSRPTLAAGPPPTPTPSPHKLPPAPTSYPPHDELLRSNPQLSPTPTPCWQSWWPYRSSARPHRSFWRYTRLHKLQRWFGMDHFVVLLPNSFSRRLMVRMLVLDSDSDSVDSVLSMILVLIRMLSLFL